MKQGDVCKACKCPVFVHRVKGGSSFNTHAAYVHGTSQPAVSTLDQYKATVREAYGSLRGITFPATF